MHSEMCGCAAGVRLECLGAARAGRAQVVHILLAPSAVRAAHAVDVHGRRRPTGLVGGGGAELRLTPSDSSDSRAMHRMRSQRADSQTRGVSRAPRAAHGQRGAFERLSIHRGVAVTLRATSPARGGRVVVTPGATRAVFTPCRASPRVARETSAVEPCCATLCWFEVRVARGVAPFVRARRPSAAHRGGAACARLARWHAPSRRCSCRAGLYRSRWRLRARWSARGPGARGRVGARPMGGSDRNLFIYRSLCAPRGASAQQATQG